MDKEKPNTITANKDKEQKEVERDIEKSFYKSPYITEYYNCYQGKTQIVTRNFLERFGKEMVEWAMKDTEAIKVSQFYLPKGISTKNISDWADKDPEFKQSYELTVEIIGNRREAGAICKKFDSNFVSFMMPMYDKQWKEMVAWKAKLKAEAEESSKAKVIILDKLVKDEESK